MLKDKTTAIHFYLNNKKVVTCDYNPCRLEDAWYTSKIDSHIDVNALHKCFQDWVENEFKSIGQHEEMYVDITPFGEYGYSFSNRGENGYLPNETHHALANNHTIWLRIGEVELRIANVDGRASIAKSNNGEDAEVIL